METDQDFNIIFETVISYCQGARLCSVILGIILRGTQKRN